MNFLRAVLSPRAVLRPRALPRPRALLSSRALPAQKAEDSSVEDILLALTLDSLSTRLAAHTGDGVPSGEVPELVAQVMVAISSLPPLWCASHCHLSLVNCLAWALTTMVCALAWALTTMVCAGSEAGVLHHVCSPAQEQSGARSLGNQAAPQAAARRPAAGHGQLQ